jgi:hypothetical protein
MISDSVFCLLSPVLVSMVKLPVPLYLLLIYLSSSSSLSSLFSSTLLAADKGTLSASSSSSLVNLISFTVLRQIPS